MYALVRNETVAEGCGQNAAWHDQLKSYNGTAITYDALGNPLNYLGKVMTWQGRKLTSIGGVALKYDYNGLRVRKGDKTYYWQGGNLVMERWVKNDTENYIYYYYDESGVCGMCYNGTEYYYRKNIFGDVIEIYNNLGELQCKYVYDAWGNHRGAKGFKKFVRNGISMVHDGGWLFGKLRKGYTVIDIGVTTMHKGIKAFGLWYGTERAVLALWRTRNIWKLPLNYFL